ncbi:MAG: ArdC family protein [Flavobacteriales bacterium]|nr:ArdC family protein [Flavobacteriales bacterium]NCP84527.1 ArdC family protein [Bacteroidota bacterium]
MSNLYTQIFSCKTRDEKKELLKFLSRQAKELIELEALEKNVNAVLIDMYKNDEHRKFKTFRSWQKKGYKVKKGEKGFFVWSKKLKGTEKAEKPEDDKEFKFFGIAYIFSNAQVEKMN